MAFDKSVIIQHKIIKTYHYATALDKSLCTIKVLVVVTFTWDDHTQYRDCFVGKEVLVGEVFNSAQGLVQSPGVVLSFVYYSWDDHTRLEDRIAGEEVLAGEFLIGVELVKVESVVLMVVTFTWDDHTQYRDGASGVADVLNH